MKQFKGFTPEQQFTLLQRLGYSGPMDQTEMNNFLQSSPEAQARMGKYANLAQKRISQMAQNKPMLAEGGYIPDQYSQLDDSNPIIQKFMAEGKTRKPETQSTTNQGVDFIQASKNLVNTGNKDGLVDPTKESKELAKTAVENPTELVTPANVAKVATDPNQFIQAGTGNAGETPQATATTVTDTATAQTPEKFDAAKYDASKVADQVAQATEDLQAAQADPSKEATVRGQLESLMADFEGGGTPVWASGAMREAMSIMQRRGMGASSMAGAAVVQAAMESAIGIASQDAATVAQFEMQNLNNRQQTAIFKTQQRIAGLFTDQAAENAAKQFNAASDNQVNQFFADLESTVSRFNADQVNGIRQFNAGQKNAIDQFNTGLKAAREEFNAKNDLIIAQANTKWRQDIATMDTAAQNEANMEYARTANGFTARALDQIWQKERDIMSYAFASSESALQRAHELLLGDKAADEREAEAKGYLFFNVLDKIGLF